MLVLTQSGSFFRSPFFKEGNRMSRIAKLSVLGGGSVEAVFQDARVPSSRKLTLADLDDHLVKAGILSPPLPALVDPRDVTTPFLRRRIVSNVRREIASGTFETEGRLDGAISSFVSLNKPRTKRYCALIECRGEILGGRCLVCGALQSELAPCT